MTGPDRFQHGLAWNHGSGGFQCDSAYTGPIPSWYKIKLKYLKIKFENHGWTMNRRSNLHQAGPSADPVIPVGKPWPGPILASSWTVTNRPRATLLAPLILNGSGQFASYNDKFTFFFVYFFNLIFKIRFMIARNLWYSFSLSENRDGQSGQGWTYYHYDYGSIIFESCDTKSFL